MTAPESIIHHYNRLNGNSITRQRLKQFHAQVQQALDSHSHGPFAKDLRGILTRVTNALKKTFDIIDRIELVPIDTTKNNGKILRVASNYEPTETKAGAESNVKEISIKEIYTDTKRFQNRTDAFSEASANNVALHFDANKFDPIVVWHDSANGKTYVLSGHSRLEGMKRRKATTIPVRYFEGTEEEAIKFARVEANRSANAENLIEDLAAYKLMRDGKEGVKPATKTELQRIFKGKVGKLEAYSHLNTGGLFIQSLSQSNTSNYPYLERNAQWVGILRNQFPVISHTGEDNIFHFFYSDKSGRNIKITKDDFFALAKKKVNQLRKDESVLFPECSSEGCRQTIDREADPQKGEAFKRLREINEALDSIREKLTSKDATVRVTTEEEKKYLRATAEKLEEEKQRINRDLDVIDKSQASLFGVGRNKDLIIKMFTIDGKPYLLEYRKQGNAREEWKADKKSALDQLIKSKQVKVVSENRKTIVYEYTPALSGPQYDAFNIQPKKKKRGPLNELQMAQLQDAIKAGRTPKVNLKAKINARQKPAPLFEEPVVDPKQTSLFGKTSKRKKSINGLVDATALAGIEFKTFELSEPYKTDFHKINSDTQVMLWGSPGHGKTVYALKFAQYVAAQLNLRTLYIAHEEFGRSTFSEKLKQHNIGHPNLKFAPTLDETVLNQFDAIFFDSINSLEMTLPDYRNLVKAHPGKLYVLIVQSTKDGDFRGGNNWEHEVDVAGEIKNRTLILHKNRFDPHNPEKMEQLLTNNAIAEAKKKAHIRQAVKNSKQNQTIIV